MKYNSRLLVTLALQRCGLFLSAILVLGIVASISLIPPPSYASELSLSSKWGGYGIDNGRFKSPQGIAIDSQGNVYVADTGNHRIQKFAIDGTFISKWGSYGGVDASFKNPRSIAVDSSGNVYVADTGNHRIQKFASDGKFITKWGGEGRNDGKFTSPAGIAIDSSGNVYVADSGNSRIQKFSGVSIQVGQRRQR